MTRVCFRAGFKTQDVDIEGNRLVFRRLEAAKEVRPDTGPRERQPGAYPFYGALKAFIRILPELDLTEPAAPLCRGLVWGNADDKEE
jgi:hypothetical protein